MEIITLLTAEMKLCTLLELQTQYNTEDIYELLEILDAGSAIMQVRNEKSEGK